jgi:hypothetical protein
MGFLCAHTMIMLLLPVAQQGSKNFHAALLSGSASILLELPFTVVKWADLSGLKPPAYAMKMEGMVANTPCHSALLTSCTGLICLAFNTQVHDVVAADGTIIHNNIPSPQSDSIPLLNFKPLGPLSNSGRTGTRTGTFTRRSRKNIHILRCHHFTLLPTSTLSPWWVSFLFLQNSKTVWSFLCNLNLLH